MKLNGGVKGEPCGISREPVTPSFGEVPAHLAGRQQIIRDLDRAFLSQRRRPELTSIFSGARGTGKTALMSSLATRAESHGWIAVKTTALPGMLEDSSSGETRRSPSHRPVQPLRSHRPRNCTARQHRGQSCPRCLNLALSHERHHRPAQRGGHRSARHG